MKRLHGLLTLIAFAPAAFLAGCYTVPETGRHALNFIPVSQEVSMGATAFTDLKSKGKVSDDPEMNASVQRVGRRIAKAVGDAMPNAEWEFVVFEDDSVNAFALPGGKVGVNTGLFRVAQNDDELAIVMGHEIAHVTARHGSERMSQGVLVALGGVALDAALQDEDSGKRNMILGAYGLGATLGYVLPYSRLDESEADQIGLKYAARAGYDPRAALRFWRGMKEESQGKTKIPEWISTHPSDDTRLKKLEQLMPSAVQEYEKTKAAAAPPAGEAAAPAPAQADRVIGAP